MQTPNILLWYAGSSAMETVSWDRLRGTRLGEAELLSGLVSCISWLLHLMYTYLLYHSLQELVMIFVVAYYGFFFVCAARS